MRHFLFSPFLQPPGLSPLPSYLLPPALPFSFSVPTPPPCPGLGSPCTSPVLISLLGPLLSIAFLKVSGTQLCTRYLNRILLGIQASNRGLFLPLPCNSSGSAIHNSSDYRLLPGRLSAFCPRLLLSRCFTPIEFGFGVIFPTIQELHSSELVCIVASYPQLQSLGFLCVSLGFLCVSLHTGVCIFSQLGFICKCN